MAHSIIKKQLWVDLLQSGQTIPQISKFTSTSPETIRNYFKRSNLLYNFSLDEHVFDRIDNKEASYWLGYLMGDGCISNTGNGGYRVNITSNDKIIIEEFKKFIKSNNHKISNNNKSYSFTITSKHMFEKLMDYGIFPRKQFIENQFVSPKISDKFFINYFGGLIDADGWIVKNGIGLSSKSKSLLENINEKCFKLFNTLGTIVFRANHWGSVYTLTFKKFDSIKLCTLIYKSSTICLQRKKLKAEILKNSFKKSNYIWKKSSGKKKYCFDLKVDNERFQKNFYTMQDAIQYRDLFMREKFPQLFEKLYF